jgi:chromate transporter
MAHGMRASSRRAPPAAGTLALVLAPLLARPALAAAGAGAAATVSLSSLFAFFVKVGSVLFGSGYVLLAFLRGELVHDRGWLTEAQLLDAVAIGQVTPGPVFTTATFIGYVLAGGPGAAAATVGIFLPAFIFVAISGPLVPHLRRSPLAGAVLDGVNAASLALMGVVTAQLAASALVDGLTLALAVASAVCLLGLSVNSSWLVLGGALVGLVADR